MNLRKGIFSLFSKHIILSWIVSYLIIFLIPFANNIYTYTKTKNEIKQRIYRTDNQMLDNLMLSFDGSISGLSAMVASVQGSEYIQNLLTLHPGTPIFEQNRINASKSMGMLKTYNSDISNLYIYLPESDYCIGTNFGADRGAFFSYVYGSTDASEENWNAHLNEFAYASYMVSKIPGGESFVDFFYSIPMLDTHVRATVVIQIASRSFYESIARYTDTQDKTLFVLDPQGQTVLGEPPVSTIGYEQIPNGISVNAKTKDIVISCTSEINKWKYVSITPRRYVTNQLSYLYFPVLISSAVCALIVCLLILYFSLENYKPLKKIISVAKRNTDDVVSQQGEYDMINNILNDYITNKQRLESIQHHELSDKRAQFLSDLANGYLNKHPNPEREMENLDIHFISDYFAVVCFNITDASQLFSDDETAEQIDDDETAKLIRFIMTNVFEELIGKYHCGYMAETHGRLMCIISFHPERLSCYHADIAEAVSKAKQFIQENFMFSFTASASSIHKGLDAVTSAYWEANKTMSYRLFIKNEDLIIFENIQNPASNNLFNSDAEHRLINFIRLGDSKIAQSIIDAIFADESIDVGQAHILTIRIVAAVSGAVLDDPDSDTAIDYSKFMRCIDRLIPSHEGYISHRDTFREFITISCDIMEQRRALHKENEEKSKEADSSASDTLLDNVKNYIQQNYSDSNLHLASLGEFFGITPYYLSNIFKKTEGVTLMDYIARLRVDKTKALIDSSDMSMSEIAANVGFNNVRTFLRTFRKLEGITPSQYRELNHK